MGYRTLRECVDDLEQHSELVRLPDLVDAKLEVAEIHRRVFQSGGPAILFERVQGCSFPMVSNLFGTSKRCEYLFRDTLPHVRRVMELAADPMRAMRQPGRYWRTPWHAWHMLPKRVAKGPILDSQCRVSDLPQLISWPADGGAFITLPLVYSENVERPGWEQSNLGMYRVQISGNQYERDQEIGLHYQIHRGIGLHHTNALRQRMPLRVNIFVGGAPALTVAAVMPLPEKMSELTFAGLLAGHRIPMIRQPSALPIYANADFCISGVVDDGRLLPEGPFGDHLGYYSLRHDFPVLRVERVWHRRNAIWPFTVVGRPPQEDTGFGALIHELTGPVIPNVLPGIVAVHAVDAAGVHPLLLALGTERYTPYQKLTRPQELLTQANAVLGQGQMSLAKYLIIANQHDDPELEVSDIGRFFQHVLRRVDWRRDVHFQTQTTIDTLDYSGTELNSGSKVVIAAAGAEIRTLPTAFSDSLPDGFVNPRVSLPGVLVIQAPAHPTHPTIGRDFCTMLPPHHSLNQFPLVVLVDDSEFTARTLNNFLWVTFTRSNPAVDIQGVGEQVVHKHWGCTGALVIDARIKAHHAPPLVEDPVITARVDALAARGGPLARWL